MRKKTIIIICVIAVIVLLFDQASKLLVEKNNVFFDGRFLKVEKVINTGMALGLNEGNKGNIAIMLLAFLLIFYFLKNQIDNIDKKTAIALGLVIGGGVSNFLDRFFRGGVLDFVRIFRIPYFNVADFCAVLGWLMLIVFLVLYNWKK